MKIEDDQMNDSMKNAIDRFWETVPQVWSLVRSHTRNIAVQNFDITEEQFHILRYIRKGTLSISELAAAKHTSRPAISQAVDAMVQKGLVTRRENTRDRRFVQLGLTDAGSVLWEDLYQQNRVWMKSIFIGLKKEELELLSQGLTVLKNAFDSYLAQTK